MGMSDKLVEKMIARYEDTFIGETEKVQYAGAGFGRHPVLLAGGLLGALFGKPRVLVVTDKSAHLVKQKKAANLTPDDVIGTYPRKIEVTNSFVTFVKIELGDEVIYLSKVLAGPLRELFPAATAPTT
jgi:hypothetical protein